MTNASKDRKISNFPAQTTIPSDAQLTYISGSTNYRISIGDFQSSIGVTGTIEQDGAVTGTPVLNIAGSVNKIRNLEPGSGIQTSVSPENGITIEHDFIEDTTGVKLVEDLTAAQPNFRSLQAGAGINISASAGVIQISESAIPVSTKTIIVNDISDFPAAVGGVITLADDTEYAIRNDIVTSNRFVTGNNCVLTGSDNIVVKLSYTGAATMFTSVNKSWTVKDLTLNCPIGTLLDFDGTTAEILQIKSCVINADILGNLDNFLGVHFDDTQLNITTDGVQFGGTNGVILLEANLTTISNGTLYNLNTATFNAFSIVDAFVTINGTSVFLDGATGSANISAGGLGSVVNCRFFGTGTPVTGISVSDLAWEFRLNNRLQESESIALASQVGNAVATVIAVAGTPVKLAGSWNDEHSPRFTIDATGRLTYDAENPLHVDISMSFSGAPVSGTNKTIRFLVALNGTPITNSGAKAIMSNGADTRVTVNWHLTMNQGDYIEAFVANDSDTVNMLITDAVLRAS